MESHDSTPLAITGWITDGQLLQAKPISFAPPMCHLTTFELQILEKNSRWRLFSLKDVVVIFFSSVLLYHFSFF